MPISPILDLRKVATLLSYRSVTSVRNRIAADPTFPRLIAISGNKVGIRESDLEAWIAERAQHGRTEPLGARAPQPVQTPKRRGRRPSTTTGGAR